MKALFDTNIVLDVALDRPQLAASSRAALTWAFEHPGGACLAWHSVATLAYFLGRHGGRDAVRPLVGELVARLDIAGGSDRELLRAIELPVSDFEDAMIVALAESVAATHIVTRNTADFRRSPVRAVTPEDFIRLLARS
ncbi:MAG: PIN domain-containing protein [Opitutaceae bacterium]|nr:PIN domain-containing protein [Opitutaceae bacterium]